MRGGLQNKSKLLYTVVMSRLYFCLALMASFFALSCERAVEAEHAAANFADVAPGNVAPVFQPPQLAREPVPMAVLQAGEFPLWFQFTSEGPSHVATIEATQNSAALIPWPHAPHVRHILAQNDELLMAVNNDGFVRLSPWQARDGGVSGIGLYRIFGGEFWRQYTVGAFVRHDLNAQPAALLYRNDWFLYWDIAPPAPRLWTFDAHLSEPRALSLASLDAFPPEEGWNLDALFRGGNGGWYFRANRRGGDKEDLMQEVRMIRVDSLDRAGESVSVYEFQNAARPEPLSAAPFLLQEMLSAAFAESGSRAASVISPGFQSVRHFSGDGEGGHLHAFFSPGAFLLATTKSGDALYIEAESFAGPQYARSFSLPALPEGFVYTGIGVVEDTVFASWEEQAGFSIGAAGFMAIRLSELFK